MIEDAIMDYVNENSDLTKEQVADAVSDEWDDDPDYVMGLIRQMLAEGTLIEAIQEHRLVLRTAT